MFLFVWKLIKAQLICDMSDVIAVFPVAIFYLFTHRLLSGHVSVVLGIGCCVYQRVQRVRLHREISSQIKSQRFIKKC